MKTQQKIIEGVFNKRFFLLSMKMISPYICDLSNANPY
jgi:hypothetical protein